MTEGTAGSFQERGVQDGGGHCSRTSMAVLQNIATAALMVIALGLTLISLRAWLYRRSRKVALLATGFALFFVKGLMLSIGLFVADDWTGLLTPSLLIDLGVLGVFYTAVTY